MNNYPSSTTEPEPLSVSVYIEQLNRVLKTQKGRVKGEVTTIKMYPWGVIFTIKDKAGNAVLDCMVWSRDYQANGVELKEGDEIIVTGCPDIHAPNGRLSFKAVTIEYAGEGALKRDYEQLKAKLAAEGMFAPDRKRPLPALPTKIGVITSMLGVVIQDFTTNLSRHGFMIKTVDSRVEGKDAIHDLLAAIRTMAKQDIEVLVIMRGGGSLESLQAFNNEAVVRAIASFKVPVLTGIGHDVDVTLSQMVADIGRSTPTAVAAALNEPWDGLVNKVDKLQDRTLGAYQQALTDKSRAIDDSSNTVFRLYERRLSQIRTDISDQSTRVLAEFSKLSRRIREANSAILRAAGQMRTSIRAKRQYLDKQPQKLGQIMRQSLRETEQTMSVAFHRITKRQRAALSASEQSVADLSRRATKGQRNAINAVSRLLPNFERTIATNDPKRNMRLGYSLSYVGGKLARSKADVTVGAAVTTHLVDGEFTSLVEVVK